MRADLKPLVYPRDGAEEGQSPGTGYGVVYSRIRVCDLIKNLVIS